MQNTQIKPSVPVWSGVTRLIEGPVGWIITLIVIPSLLAAVLLLPPVSLLDRLEAFTYTRIGPSGGAVSDPDQTTLVFPAEGIESSFAAHIESVPRADFIEGRGGRTIYDAARNLPDYLIPKSPFYNATVRGGSPQSVIITTPIPNDSLPYETLGLYRWTGQNWEHVPSMVFPTEDMVEARLSYVPEYFMVMQSVPQMFGEVEAGMEFGQTLPDNAVTSGEMVAGLYLRGDGALDGNAPVNNGNTTPIIRNWTGEPWAPTVRTDLINNMLIEVGQQENQLNAVEQTILANGYPGVVIDYRGVDAVPSAKADFVFLMKRLADRLHANDKTLAIRVEGPTQISAEDWDTKGHDWRALSAVADTIIVPAPLDPLAYQENGEFESLLTYATSEVDRRKLQIEFPVQSVERAGRYLLPQGYSEALQPLMREFDIEDGSAAEITLELDNERILNAVTWDEGLGMYTYSYEDDQGFERTVYLESAASMARKLATLQQYNVRQINLQNASTTDIDPGIWKVLQQFQNGEELAPATSRLDVSYTIYDAEGNLVTNEVRPIEDSRLLLKTPSDEMSIQATVIDGSGRALSSSLKHDIGTALAIASSQGEDDAVAGDELAVEAAEAGPEFPNLSTGQIVNVRNGPGTVYNVLGQITPGNTYRVTGKNPQGDWWQIEYAGGNTGWVIGSLVDTAGDMSTVAMAENIPEVPQVAEAPAEAPAAQAAAAEPAAQAAQPAPVQSAPVTGGGPGFGYGVQAHMVHTGQEGQVMAMTKGLGFNWVKQQIEWKVFESSPGGIDFGSSDPIVNAANGAGINLLFSAVNAPAWAREPGHDGSVGGPPEDPQTFANFLGAMAAKYCGSSVKAIEVWNEQNLHYEWGNKPLNPQEYVNLLAPSYNAIKSACPEMIVVSGALTPAGNNGNLAMDDFAYLEGMFQAGMANYADAIGAHPSGYNVPPDHTWETACEAIQADGASFMGACDSPHHSWSFRSTMEGYRNIANVYGASNMRIWPTEFGWAAGGAFDPRYKYADDNDFQEQAEWTVRAFQMMREWGWVGPAFLWNLNFRVVANGTEKAQWGIVDSSWNPLPVYNALRDMPK